MVLINNFTKIILGLSIVASSSLFASGNHEGEHSSNENKHMDNHMHNGKMSNHMK